MYRGAIHILLAAALVMQTTGGALALHQVQHDADEAAHSPHHAAHHACYEAPASPARVPAPVDSMCELCHLLIGGTPFILTASHPAPDADTSAWLGPRGARPIPSAHPAFKQPRAPPLA